MNMFRKFVNNISYLLVSTAVLLLWTRMSSHYDTVEYSSLLKNEIVYDVKEDQYVGVDNPINRGCVSIIKNGYLSPRPTIYYEVYDISIHSILTNYSESQLKASDIKEWTGYKGNDGMSINMFPLPKGTNTPFVCLTKDWRDFSPVIKSQGRIIGKGYIYTPLEVVIFLFSTLAIGFITGVYGYQARINLLAEISSKNLTEDK